jgi:hypothetical protein
MEIKENEKEGICEICGGGGADYVEDPYNSEMEGESYQRWLCSYCYNDLKSNV